MRHPKLLDLFCCEGGAGYGYRLAGFDVTGIDNKPMPRYPFQFVQADALEYLAEHGHEYDAIHASPPCQGYSQLRHLPWLKGKEWPMLIKPTLDLLDATGKPWIVENVEAAWPEFTERFTVTLCGQMFGLPVFRHRLFASNCLILVPAHVSHREVIGHGRMVNNRRKGTLNAGSSKGSWGNSKIVTVAGGQFRKADGERALGIDWMSKAGLCQAIPPAYTEYLGRQLIQAVELAA